MTATQLGGFTGKGFLPGQSGNPGGRPKGLEALAREITNDGRKIIALMHDVMMVEGQFSGARIPLNTRMEAANWLADRGWGKPSQVTDVRVDIEQRILTLAADLGLDPQEAASEMARVIEGQS